MITYIGIDTGVNTGVAISKGGELLDVATMPIHKALKLVEHISTTEEVFVMFEDARQRRWIPDGNRAQGAGSVKRDAKIWEDFCRDLDIPFRAVPPRKGATKWGADTFSRVTGWKGRTSNHARDAALLVYGK